MNALTGVDGTYGPYDLFTFVIVHAVVLPLLVDANTKVHMRVLTIRIMEVLVQLIIIVRIKAVLKLTRMTQMKEMLLASDKPTSLMIINNQ